jgi:hypothetical protein
MDDRELARLFNRTEREIADILQRGRQTLLARRNRRTRPHLDDKVIAAWNGLAISALARVGFALAEPRYLAAAAAAADLLQARLTDPDGRLLRTYRGGVARHRGCLDDYAFVVAGLLDLHQATHQPRWLAAARRYQSVVDRDFAAPAGGYYATGAGAERLLVREQPWYDGAEPSGNAVTALNLLRLEQLTGEPAFRAAAERTLGRFADELTARGEAMPKMLAAVDAFRDDPPQIVIARRAGDDAEPLLGALRRVYLPDRTVAVVDGAEPDAERPWFAAGHQPAPGPPTAQVCRRAGCGLPTADPARFADELGAVVG